MINPNSTKSVFFLLLFFGVVFAGYLIYNHVHATQPATTAGQPADTPEETVELPGEDA